MLNQTESNIGTAETQYHTRFSLFQGHRTNNSTQNWRCFMNTLSTLPHLIEAVLGWSYARCYNIWSSFRKTLQYNSKFGAVLVARSSQTRILGMLMVSSCVLVGGWRDRFSVCKSPLHFGQAKVWAEDDWDAARSLCFKRLVFAASYLSVSNLRLAFLTEER